MEYSLLDAASILLAAVSRGNAQCVPISSEAVATPARHMLPVPELAQKSYRAAHLNKPEVHVILNLTVSHRLIIKNNGSPLSIPRILPGYYKQVNREIESHRIKNNVLLQQIRIDQPCYVVFTPKYKEYGHFLIETLPKMLVARHLIDEGARFRILTPLNPPAWVQQYIEMLFREDELIYISEFSQEATISCAIIPGLLGNGSLFHPLFVELINKYLVGDRGSHIERSQRIFISRKRFFSEKQQANFRYWENESEFRDLVVEAGFEVVEPQLLSVREQLHLFSLASRIVGESSSALHNTLFSGRECQVLAINYVNPIQTHICGARGQTLDYVIPSDGTNRSWENNGKVPKSYRVTTDRLMEWLAAIRD